MTSFCLGNINPGEVRAEFMQSVLGVMTSPRPDDLELVEFITKTHGPYLDVGRNFVVQRFLSGTDADVLLFVDSDMEFTPGDVHGIVRKCSAAQPVIGGMYVNWFADFGVRPVALDWVEVDGQRRMDPIELPDPDGGPVPVDCVGTGFMAIHRSLLDRMTEVFGHPMPWFAEVVMHGSQMGEDVTFCQRAIHLGHPVVVDPSITVGHHKTQLFHPSTYLAAQPKEPSHA